MLSSEERTETSWLAEVPDLPILKPCGTDLDPRSDPRSVRSVGGSTRSIICGSDGQDSVCKE